MFVNRLEFAALYAAANLLILLVLAYLVTRARQTHKVSLGDGGNEAVTRAMRAHANAAEYIPVGLIGLTIFALMQAPAAPLWLFHGCGLGLTVGRLTHAFGMYQPGVHILRRVGTGLTWLTLLALALGLAFAGLTGGGG